MRLNLPHLAKKQASDSALAERSSMREVQDKSNRALPSELQGGLYLTLSVESGSNKRTHALKRTPKGYIQIGSPSVVLDWSVSAWDASSLTVSATTAGSITLYLF